MFGYIVYESGERRGRLEQRNLLGVRVLEAAVPGRRQVYGALAARRLAAAMARRGVKQAVFPQDFPFAQAFWRRGVLPVNTLELYRALAGRAVKEGMAGLGLAPAETTAAVTAERITGGVEELVTELCREPKMFEEILQGVFARYQLTMDFNQYVLVGSTVRSYLAYLLDRGAAAAEFDDNRLLWRAV